MPYPTFPPKWEILIAGDVEPFTPVSEDEAKSYAIKIGARKTPEPDGVLVLNVILKQTMEENPEGFGGGGGPLHALEESGAYYHLSRPLLNKIQGLD